MRKGSGGDLGKDAFEYLPTRFVLVYTELVRKGLAGVGSSMQGMGERRGGEKQGPIRDEEAIAWKRKIDRTLRALAREYETGHREERPKCGHCGKFVQREWLFCALCGERIGLGDSDARKVAQGPERGTWDGVRLR